jgi:hypothetical protein
MQNALAYQNVCVHVLNSSALRAVITLLQNFEKTVSFSKQRDVCHLPNALAYHKFSANVPKRNNLLWVICCSSLSDKINKNNQISPRFTSQLANLFLIDFVLSICDNCVKLKILVINEIKRDEIS